MLIQIDKLVQLLESPVFTCYLHIAPRAGSVLDTMATFSFHQRQKSITESHNSSSTPSNAAPSSFDRSSRLKGRDEGGIRWNELLEKFRSVQEKSRRAQRLGGILEDDLEGRMGDELNLGAFKDLARLPGPPLQVKDAPVVPVAAANKSKTSLGKFGRLGGVARPKR
ncbi:vac14 [Hyphodiscus hymeniophilus]|uniref:Vac14 n=1 Tax=Hyphodiscus hymeniophilus TaxID=353542 RepID=A0A9P6VGH3_9HELO|nr:vac14 [Hyphodiscus hymeniophilus]